MFILSLFWQAVNLFFAKNQHFFAEMLPAAAMSWYDRKKYRRAGGGKGTYYMKIMAIDYGDAHTGIAISDRMETLAGFTTVINSRRQEEVIAQIRQLIAEHGVERLVLGYPKNMDGTLGPRAEKCAALGEILREETGLPLILWDERRSTVEAHAILFAGGKNGKQRKKIVDAVAASLMLEGYLTRRRLEAEQ